MKSRRTNSKSLTKDELVCELELRETTAALEIERQKARKYEPELALSSFSDFYNHSPVAFVTFDEMARVKRANDSLVKLLEITNQRILGAPFTMFAHPQSCSKFLQHLRACRRASRQSVSTEIELRRMHSASPLPVKLISSRLPSDKGQLFETAIIDLSDQKAATNALTRAYEHAEAIVLSLPYPVLVVDNLLRVVNGNKAFFDVFRTSEGAVKKWVFTQLPDVQWETPNLDELLLKAMQKKALLPEDYCVHATLRSDSTLALRMTVRQLRPAGTDELLWLLTFEDVTRRKRIEEEREQMLTELREARAVLERRVEERTQQLAQSLSRLREISEQLMLAHESEQRRIARELHDQIGQDLTALRLMFNRAARDEKNPERQTFADAEKVTEEAIQNVRNICGTLRPQLLDDVGLLAGLSNHIKTFGARSNLQIDFEHNSFDEKRLSPILQSAVFRVIQEALTNVARHAQTKKANVVLWMTDDDVLFRIQDFGKGFRTDAPRTGHSGISNMRERVALVNGQYDLKSRPGRGTTIQIQIPLQSTPTSNTNNNNGKNTRRGRS